jgi:hypothetical protein
MSAASKSLNSEPLVRGTGYAWYFGGTALLVLIVVTSRAGPLDTILSTLLVLPALLLGRLLVLGRARRLVLALSVCFGVLFLVVVANVVFIVPAFTLIFGLGIAGLILSFWSVVVAVYGLPAPEPE